MAIPVSHMKERLSVAYVRAVVARAGALYLSSDGTEYGTDAIVQKVKLLPNGRYTGTGWSFRCQLKATTTWEESGQYILYDLDVDAYNKLVEWEGNSCILIVLRLPQNQDEWLTLDENSLKLRNCCYWAHLTGAPSANRSTVRISIPRNQLFSPEAVNTLLDSIAANQGTLS